MWRFLKTHPPSPYFYAVLGPLNVFMAGLLIGSGADGLRAVSAGVALAVGVGACFKLVTYRP